MSGGVLACWPSYVDVLFLLFIHIMEENAFTLILCMTVTITLIY